MSSQRIMIFTQLSTMIYSTILSTLTCANMLHMTLYQIARTTIKVFYKRAFILL